MNAYDDPLYRELIPCRPSDPDPCRMADGPTAQWLTHNWSTALSPDEPESVDIRLMPTDLGLTVDDVDAA